MNARAICRGSYALGSACGRCVRCAQEKAKLAGAGWVEDGPNRMRPPIGEPDKLAERVSIIDVKSGMSLAEIDDWIATVAPSDDADTSESVATAMVIRRLRAMLGDARDLLPISDAQAFEIGTLRQQLDHKTARLAEAEAIVKRLVIEGKMPLFDPVLAAQIARIRGGRDA